MLINDFYLIIGIPTHQKYFTEVYTFFFLKFFHKRFVIKKGWHYKLKHQFFKQNKSMFHLITTPSLPFYSESLIQSNSLYSKKPR